MHVISHTQIAGGESDKSDEESGDTKSTLRPKGKLVRSKYSICIFIDGPRLIY